MDEQSKMKRDLERQGYISGVKAGNMLAVYTGIGKSYNAAYRKMKKVVPHKTICWGATKKHYYLQSEVEKFIKRYI